MESLNQKWRNYLSKMWTGSSVKGQLTEIRRIWNESSWRKRAGFILYGNSKINPPKQCLSSINFDSMSNERHKCTQKATIYLCSSFVFIILHKWMCWMTAQMFRLCNMKYKQKKKFCCYYSNNSTFVCLDVQLSML